MIFRLLKVACSIRAVTGAEWYNEEDDSRIYHGSSFDPKDVPYLVGFTVKDGAALKFCTGTFISKRPEEGSRFVLTSAHCVNQLTPSDAKKTSVKFEVKEHKNTTYGTNVTWSKSVDVVDVHLMSNPSDTSKDLALLELKYIVPPRQNKGFNVEDLDVPDFSKPDGPETAKTYGCGSDALKNNLRKDDIFNKSCAMMPVFMIPEKKCKSNVPGHEIQCHQPFKCAGDNVQSRPGDSGMPVVVTRGKGADAKDFIVGVHQGKTRDTCFHLYHQMTPDSVKWIKTVMGQY